MLFAAIALPIKTLNLNENGHDFPNKLYFSHRKFTSTPLGILFQSKDIKGLSHKNE